MLAAVGDTLVTASADGGGRVSVLVVLDYSGTLSTGSVRFAQPRSLAKSLERSGLADLGVAEPAILWSEVIDPTWQQGSTGVASYTECVALGVRRLKPGADSGLIRIA
jgi:hypothetical protein